MAGGGTGGGGGAVMGMVVGALVVVVLVMGFFMWHGGFGADTHNINLNVHAPPISVPAAPTGH